MWVVQDKVVASRLPNHWDLGSIFIVGIVYGLYLTLSTWVLYYVATHTSFFQRKLKMNDLRYKPRSYLEDHCRRFAIPGAVRPALAPHPTSVTSTNDRAYLRHFTQSTKALPCQIYIDLYRHERSRIS